MTSPLPVPVVRLDPDLPLPAYAKPGDAGLDLLAREAAVPEPGGRALVPTGMAISIPAGHAGFVQPRSGLALAHHLGRASFRDTVCQYPDLSWAPLLLKIKHKYY